MELGIQIKQSQTLSPQMVQSMEILQMGTQELLEYIQEAQLENPTLEEEAAPAVAPDVPSGQVQEWDGQNSWYDREDWKDSCNRPTFDRADRPLGAENLGEYLRSQLNLSGELSEAVNALIDSLDHWGYLEEELSEISTRTGRPLPLLEDGLALIQRLDPPGVGAQSLSQCLILQLNRLGEDGLPQRLVEEFLPQLAQSHFHAIAQQTGERREEIQRGVELIRSLNPKPGATFGGWESTSYIVPDVYILEGDGGLYVRLNGGEIPSLTVSPYYRSLLMNNQDEEVTNYLKTKLRQANWLIQGISQRQETLGRCTNLILQRQQDFFCGRGEIKPLLLHDVAEALDIHESTVSRAMRDKYLQCSRGVFPLSHFFSRNVGGEGEDTTAHQVKARLQTLMDGEDKKKPLSDQKLCDILNAEGMKLSRRTVAKYRDALGLPSAPGRRIL